MKTAIAGRRVCRSAGKPAKYFRGAADGFFILILPEHLNRAAGPPARLPATFGGGVAGPPAKLPARLRVLKSTFDALSNATLKPLVPVFFLT